MPEKLLEWEQIAENTFRLPVYGGWIVTHNNPAREGAIMARPIVSESGTFVPDYHHKWSIKIQTDKKLGDLGRILLQKVVDTVKAYDMYTKSEDQEKVEAVLDEIGEALKS